MKNMTPQEFREKQARNLKNASGDIQRGIENVSVAPGEMAAKKEAKLKQNWLAAVDSGKWARNVSAVPLEEWKKKTIEKGLPRIAAGIDAAAGKVEDFASQLLPFQKSLSDTVQKMPDTTLDDNLNRMVAFARGMAGFEYKKNR